MAYPLHRPSAPVPASPDLPSLEKDVLAYWDADGTFQASIDARPAGENGSNEYVFYDGPPFANGLPHYGHLLTGYAKDVVPRYQTMRGHHVERRFGWDTHGLPAELEAQRLLGITDTSQIEEMGLAAFNQACRESVLRYTGEWREYVTRQARWVDFDHDYKTLDTTFMESVIWAFKRLYDKGLAYEGYRVLPYCWRDETPLSNHELRMDDDVYQSRQDPALTVGLRLETGELRADLDDDAVDAAEQPRDRGRAGRGLRDGRAGSGLGARGRARGAGRGAARRVRQGARRGDRRRDRQGPRPGRPPVHAAVRLLRRPRERPPGAARRLRHHRGRLGHRAHGAGVRRGRHGRVRGRRHRARRARRLARPVHHRGPGLRRPAGVRGQQADHGRPQGGHRTLWSGHPRTSGPSSCGTRRTSTPTRTAGAAGTR